MANNRMALVCKKCNSGISIAKFYPGDEHNAGYTEGFLLGELIEACGDRFDQLDKDLDGFHCRPCIGVCERYNTPEEAVAKLWLVLNKK